MFALDLCKVIEKEIQKKINVLFDELVEKHGLDRKELQKIWEGNSTKTPTAFMKMNVKTLKEECKKRNLSLKSKKKMDYVNALLDHEKQQNRKNDSIQPSIVVPERVEESSLENQAPELVPDNEIIEPQPVEVNNPDNEIVEPQPVEVNNPDNEIIEPQPVEVNDPDNHALIDESVSNSEIENESLVPLASVSPPSNSADEVNSHVSDITFESREQVGNNQNQQVPLSVVDEVTNNQQPLASVNENLDLEELQEKINGIVKIPFHKMSVKELKKTCLGLGFDCKKKARKDFIEFLEKYEMNQQKETNFENFLVDPNQVIFE